MCGYRKQSIGLKIFGFLMVLFSIILLGSFVYFNMRNKELFSIQKNLIISLYILCLFASSIGIILLKEWARVLLIIISTIKLFGSIMSFLNYAVNNVSRLLMFHLFEQSIPIIVFSLIIYYLCKKSTRNQFKVNQ